MLYFSALSRHMRIFYQIKAMKWLVAGARPGDHFVFHCTWLADQAHTFLKLAHEFHQSQATVHNSWRQRTRKRKTTWTKVGGMSSFSLSHHYILLHTVVWPADVVLDTDNMPKENMIIDDVRYFLNSRKIVTDPQIGNQNDIGGQPAPWGSPCSE